MARKRLCDPDDVRRRFADGETIKQIADDLKLSYQAIKNHIYPEEAKRRNKEYQEKNKDVLKEKQKIYNKENKDVIAERMQSYHFQRKYGITIERYDEMYEKQNGLCAICLEPETKIGRKSENVQILSVDHNHETGEIRGLLCAKCNLGIGYLREDINLIIRASEYLKLFQ